jgi:hypothetical protein
MNLNIIAYENVAISEKIIEYARKSDEFCIGANLKL